MKDPGEREAPPPRLLIHPNKWILFFTIVIISESFLFDRIPHFIFFSPTPLAVNVSIGHVRTAPSSPIADSWVPLALNGLERAARCRRRTLEG